VWKLLGIYDTIKKAIKVDRADETILEHLLCFPEQDIQVLRLPKLKEAMATAAWYLWFEHRKLTQGEATHNAAQLTWQ
jgi:hypothetical protein